MAVDTQIEVGLMIFAITDVMISWLKFEIKKKRNAIFGMVRYRLYGTWYQILVPVVFFL